MSKLNHFICPTCGHDFYDTGAYSMCDGCLTHFYVSGSRTSHPHRFTKTTVVQQGFAGLPESAQPKTSGVDDRSSPQAD